MFENPAFSRFFQVGIVVSDLDKAVAYFESIGIGPFQSLPDEYERAVVAITARGKSIPVDSVHRKVKLANLPCLQIEVIEPGEGKNIWREFLETKGEGVHHLAFVVDDVEGERLKLEERGLTCLGSVKLQNGGGAAYLKPPAGGADVIVELVSSGEMKCLAPSPSSS